MVLFLGFAAAMVALLLVAFNSGQITNSKMRAMNAADAAAYSGAVWQARTLNFQAYMNRAMVVNEVTIAQSVSLRSWISYLDRFVTNINYITRFVPYLGAATTAVQRVISGIDTAAQTVLPPIDIVMRGFNFVEHNVGQDALNLSGALVAQDLAANVARLNGAEFSSANPALFLINEKRWNTFTKTYSKSSGRVGTDGRTRIRQVALDSRDGFTTARDWSAGAKPLFGLRKQGGTDLIDFDAWKGLDSAKLGIGWNFIKGEWIVDVPLGWGGAQSYAPRKKTQVGRHGNTNEWGDMDGVRANAEANNKNAKNIQTEFQAYRDVANLSAPTSKNDPFKLPFSVEVVIKQDKIPVAETALKANAMLSDGSKLSANPNLGGGGVYALATACVSFDRPYRSDRQDGKTEYPSLFNPYWRASLATDGRVARGIADATKGLPPIASLLGGDSTCS
ncbi:hypothetical protein ACO0KY_15540 [Undibacterium sp. Dicai25W]